MTRAERGTAPLRVDGYVRVSRVGKRRGPGFISPRVQAHAIGAWAAARNARLVHVFEELDESGARADRPLLEAAIRRCEIGESDGVVVHRVDRFGRSLIDSLVAIDRVRRAGGEFFSAHEGLDTTTETGRLVVRILMSVAEWELERIRDSWESARADAVARGIHGGAVTAVGYRRSRSGRLRPDPVTAPLISELFRRRASGESVRSLARWLEAQGVRTALGNPGWSATATGRVLANPVYLGQARCGPYVNDHAHPALTDGPTWEAAQHPHVTDLRRHPPEHLLVGIVRCASCGMRLNFHPAYDRNKHRSVYACRKHHAGGHCPAPASISATVLDELVCAAAFDVLRHRRRAPRVALQATEARLNEAESALSAYRDSPRLQRVLGTASFLRGLEARQAQLRAARAEVTRLRARHDLHTLLPVRELRFQWEAMNLTQRRELIARIFDVVFVKPGRRHYADRVMLCPTGTGPAGLPHPGRRRSTLRSYEMRRGWVRPVGRHSP